MHTYDYYLPYFEIPLKGDWAWLWLWWWWCCCWYQRCNVMEMIMRPTNLTDSSLLKNFIFSINLQYCEFWISVTKNIVDDIFVIIIIIVMLPLCSLIYDPVPGTMTLSICFETCHQNDFKPHPNLRQHFLWDFVEIWKNISSYFCDSRQWCGRGRIFTPTTDQTKQNERVKDTDLWEFQNKF